MEKELRRKIVRVVRLILTWVFLPLLFPLSLVLSYLVFDDTFKRTLHNNYLIWIKASQTCYDEKNDLKEGK